MCFLAINNLSIYLYIYIIQEIYTPGSQMEFCIHKKYKSGRYVVYCTHRLYSMHYRSLTTYRLWSLMLRFVYDKIKLYNVRERRVHLTEASPIGFVQNVHCMSCVNVLWLSCTTRCLGALSDCNQEIFKSESHLNLDTVFP